MEKHSDVAVADGDGPSLDGDDDQLLSEDDAAKLLNMSVRTLQGWRWNDDPSCPPYVKAGAKKVGYRRGALRAWIKAREQGPKRRRLKQPKPGQSRGLRARRRSGKG